MGEPREEIVKGLEIREMTVGVEMRSDCWPIGGWPGR